ncbi:MAG: DNA repair protein RecO [Gemmatimonadota bacterium]
MSLLTVEGILLRSHAFSESSRILRFLTPGEGLLSVMARGVRKRSGKGGGGVETFDQASVVCSYRPDRDLHSARDVQVTRSRRGLASHMTRFAGASLVAELVLAHTLQEADPPLFEAVARALDALETAPLDALGGILLSAGWGILSHAGFPPSIDRCASCGAVIPEQGLLGFFEERGGILCGACSAAGRQGEPSRTRLGPGARADLARLVEGDPPVPLRGAASHLGLLERFALHHFGATRPFRSVPLLRPLLQDPETTQS